MSSSAAMGGDNNHHASGHKGQAGGIRGLLSKLRKPSENAHQVGEQGAPGESAGGSGAWVGARLPFSLLFEHFGSVGSKKEKVRRAAAGGVSCFVTAPGSRREDGMLCAIVLAVDTQSH